MRKKVILILLSLVLIMSMQPIYAAEYAGDKTVEYLPDGSYFETIVQTEPSAKVLASVSRSSSITKSKTKTYKNASGTALWYVKVTGTYTYGSGTATCTSSSVTAASTSTTWKITSKSSSKSGATATAKATAKQYVDGTLSAAKTATVQLTCRSDGTVY